MQFSCLVLHLTQWRRRCTKQWRNALPLCHHEEGRCLRFCKYSSPCLSNNPRCGRFASFLSSFRSESTACHFLLSFFFIHHPILWHSKFESGMPRMPNTKGTVYRGGRQQTLTSWHGKYENQRRRYNIQWRENCHTKSKSFFVPSSVDVRKSFFNHFNKPLHPLPGIFVLWLYHMMIVIPYVLRSCPMQNVGVWFSQCLHRGGHAWWHEFFHFFFIPTKRTPWRTHQRLPLCKR